MIYLDSSAAVKRYIVEAGSGDVRSLLALGEPVVTSPMTYVEVAAAIARRSREGAFGPSDAQGLRAQLSRDWEALVVLELTAATLERAAELAFRHALRAYDAVHLASALEWRDAIDEQVTFATFDRPLHRAAANAGLDAWPASPGGAFT